MVFQKLDGSLEEVDKDIYEGELGEILEIPPLWRNCFWRKTVNGINVLSKADVSLFLS